MIQIRMKKIRVFTVLYVLFINAYIASRAEEGMWLFSAPPTEEIKSKYNFEISHAWLDHVMTSSVRFNSGGSGSFVSADGLVITNHHVGLDALQKMSNSKVNYVKSGFYAESSDKEVKCLDLELNVLQSIEDVTNRVNAAVPLNVSTDIASKARRAIISSIEKESLAKTGLRSDVVTLYQGGSYQLYRSKRYTDVRLVFAPEQQSAFFGGDPDNFEYPRYDLDICIFRVYENNLPIHPKDYLKWSRNGASEGDLVFVSGHPGNTDRMRTVAELKTFRDLQFPYLLQILKRKEVLLTSWSARSIENKRIAKERLFGIQNSRKVRDGMLATLQDSEFFSKKEKEENNLRELFSKNEKYKSALDAFKNIENAQHEIEKYFIKTSMLENEVAFDCDSFGIARILLRSAIEYTKPNSQRLSEYGDARRQSLELQLFSDKPIDVNFEIIRLSDSLTALVEKLGYNDPTVQLILAGKSPRSRASELIMGTKVRDLEFRRKIYNSKTSYILALDDPMLNLVNNLDKISRELREKAESLSEIKKQAQAILGKAKYDLNGASTYPDATFTLRLSYGTIKGYEENGVNVPAFTNLAGLYERAQNHEYKEPFDLPDRWFKNKEYLSQNTHYNFVSTCDIIGGNSGSPTINKKGEFVGIIFDGNIQSLASDFQYSDQMSRALSVDSSGIIETLTKIYHVQTLVSELSTGHR